MNKQKSAIKAAFWYMVSNFISKTILYLCTPFFTRILTVSEFGKYNNFLSWQNILLAIFAMDLGASITVAYFDYDDESIFQSFISTISLASVFIPLLLSICVVCFKDFFTHFFNLEGRYLTIMLFNLVLGNTLQIFQIEQRTRVEYRLSSFLTLLSAIGTVLLTFILLYKMSDKLFAILIGNVTFNIAVSVILLFYLLKRKLSFQWKHLEFALFLAVPLIPHALSAAVTGSSGQILITKFCGSEKTALFGLAFTISMVITMFISSINKAWVPWFYDNVKHENIDRIKTATRQILPILAMCTVGFCLLSPEIIMMVGGKKYLDAVYLMPPIMLSCFFNYAYTLYVNIEFYEKKTYLISIGTICTAIINLLLNYILLQRFAYYVAAYTSFFTALLLLSLHYAIVKRMKKDYIFDNAFILKILLFTSLLCFSLLLTYEYSFLRLFCFFLYFLVVIVVAVKKRNIIRHLIS